MGQIYDMNFLVDAMGLSYSNEFEGGLLADVL